MGIRTTVGVAIGLAYAAFVVHAASGAQCPARELGPCAQVHALISRKPAFGPDGRLIQPASAEPVMAMSTHARGADIETLQVEMMVAMREPAEPGVRR